MTRRPSQQTLTVLDALADDPTAWRYGYELGRQFNLKAGSLYPILMRLCDRGLPESSWETEPPQGRPARHLYRLVDPVGLWFLGTVAASVLVLSVRSRRVRRSRDSTPGLTVVGDPPATTS